jgi:hypothetical protein
MQIEGLYMQIEGLYMHKCMLRPAGSKAKEMPPIYLYTYT